ncbi:PHA/PHB synthase family protein [Candidatus Thiodictyon syntrophicum]|jgi:polyhydroxyalkanoate synthase|uniref:Poly-beta-hydroxybutyrate polymerase n=1 Tax=Candidatus Thiodictyon syntrophicum TaxID=1166950 RepID=A0A2K8UFX5_9GAMM|nr:alpha/beta fold hydrolase [Candidatus Thiodictyon syntrophicum]AUB84427.1 poly-beta-hydroxybutyrate polymerase [Candidatus Thiodictyon syntrophicum]
MPDPNEPRPTNPGTGAPVVPPPTAVHVPRPAGPALAAAAGAGGQASAAYRVDAIARSLLGSQVPETIDRMVNANLARATGGISPTVLAMAYSDWLLHLGLAPGKQALLTEKAVRKLVRLAVYAGQSLQGQAAAPCIAPLPQDHRFAGEGWQQWPYNLIYQSFLLTQQWWHNATTHNRGVDERNEAIVSFVTRQILDMFSPSNSPLTNPEILKATMAEGGQNLVRGWTNFLADMQSRSGAEPRDASSDTFVVGRDVAVTPGQVIFRNALIELIQYQPVTPLVYAEPILIVPAWIMKYYILDLSPHNSLIRYLVEQGHTVFTISWLNPGAEDRDLGLADYRREGVMAALDAISAIRPGTAVHAVGYCLGGTLLTIAAAAMARDNDQRLKTVTLLAAQTDFTEAGELLLFINENQVAFLEDVMSEQGYLGADQMAGAFQLLRSNDLIWSRLIHDYLLGRRQSQNDLMAWNADPTRLPFRMHSQYLRQLFLRNELATGHYRVDDRPIAITDIQASIFAVATEKDHVAPWRSVYKINLLADAEEVTFLLTSGGHNAGIVSEPGHARRSYQVASRTDADRYVDPDTWQATTPRQSGSWWPVWEAWLVRYSAAQQVPPPALGAPEKGLSPLCAAPGTYVLRK